MSEQNQPLDNSSASIWAKRITDLLHERGLTQLQLAQMSGVSRPSISEWLNNRNPREPKITGFKAVADALEVSTDYLLGGNECTTPNNEEIHKITGLSDKAIKKLRRLQRRAKKNNGSAAKKLAACNYLLEAMDSTDFFESLYNYLLGEFYFSKRGKDLGASNIYTTDPTGEEKEVLAFAENYSHVYLSKILQDLSLMKKATDEEKLKREKEWYESDEGKAADRKEWEEMMEELEKEGKV